MIKPITSLDPPTRLHIRTGTFLGDELGSNSNLKCSKHRRMVTGDDVISATYKGTGIGPQENYSWSLYHFPKEG